VKITYFNKRERKKQVRGVILGQKLTINHRSLVDEGEEILDIFFWGQILFFLGTNWFHINYC